MLKLTAPAEASRMRSSADLSRGICATITKRYGFGRGRATGGDGVRTISISSSLSPIQISESRFVCGHPTVTFVTTGVSISASSLIGGKRPRREGPDAAFPAVEVVQRDGDADVRRVEAAQVAAEHE